MIGVIEERFGKGKVLDEVSVGVSISDIEDMATREKGKDGFTVIGDEVTRRGAYVIQKLVLFNKRKELLIVTSYERHLDGDGYVMAEGLIEEEVRVYEGVGTDISAFKR